jgi:hypothetical protein
MNEVPSLCLWKETDIPPAAFLQHQEWASFPSKHKHSSSPLTFSSGNDSILISNSLCYLMPAWFRSCLQIYQWTRFGKLSGQRRFASAFMRCHKGPTRRNQSKSTVVCKTQTCQPIELYHHSFCHFTPLHKRPYFTRRRFGFIISSQGAGVSSLWILVLQRQSFLLHS